MHRLIPHYQEAKNKKRHLYYKAMSGQQNGSVGIEACHQVQPPEFKTQESHGGRRELSPPNFHLTYRLQTHTAHT